ncbi:hypothetical protein ACQ4PT_017690 [Festuca glaucescens]
MGAVAMASSSLALRPRASSSHRPLRPSRAAAVPAGRAALPAPRTVATTQLSVERSPPVSETTTTTRLYSLAPYPLLLAALLPGAESVTAAFQPFVEIVKTFNLPDWLVHWGHPGNMVLLPDPFLLTSKKHSQTSTRARKKDPFMAASSLCQAVVLFAMGGYGTYLGFRIKLSDDPEEKAKAKDLHPKLLGGMFFFFAAGATGGVTALLTSGKPIFESPHAVTGIIGLALLTVQSLLPTLFEGNPGLRGAHGLLGSSIMTLFLFHAAFGLQLGLSF